MDFLARLPWPLRPEAAPAQLAPSAELSLSVADSDEWRFRLLQTGLCLHVGSSAALWLWPMSRPGAWSLMLLTLLACAGAAAAKYATPLGAALFAVSALEYFNVPLLLAPIAMANHNLVEHAIFGLSLFATPGRADRRADVLKAGRATMVVVLFYAGCQKAWHGHYFDGQYFGWLNVHEPRFVQFFSDLGLSRHFTSTPTGAPYGATTPLGMAFSNGAWISEICCGLLLLSRRWQGVGVVLSLMTMGAIQIAARELFFAGLAAQLLVLFLPFRTSAACAPVIWSFYLVLIAERLMFNGMVFGR